MWAILPEKEKELYKKSIQAYASLSEAFSQKNEDINCLVPVINSKYQEKQFCSCFNGTVEDIGNTAFDASLVQEINGKTYKFLVGIKTFRFDSFDQKIAQFKKDNRDWESLKHKIKMIANETNDIEEFNRRSGIHYQDLAIRIATLRNQRIDSAISKLRGFKVEDNDQDVESVYHVLMPSNKDIPTINVGETKYEKIDIENIRIIKQKSFKFLFNFEFDDGKHLYKYTDSDSQLSMNFKNDEIVIEKWPVKFRINPGADLINLLESNDTNTPIQKVTESYNWKISVKRYSGFNSFFGLGSKLGNKKRKEKARKFIDGIRNKYDDEFVKKIKRYLDDFCDIGNNSQERKKHRENVRDLARIQSMGVMSEIDFKKLINLMYRPNNEFYIPIPDSKNFHINHPNFFGENKVKFKKDGKKLDFAPKDRSFNLIFEPSGNVIKSYITQDLGKAIESVDMQSILGKWILEDVLQVKDYQPVTQNDLDNMNINAMRLYKIKGEPSSNVHLEFVWVNEDE